VHFGITEMPAKDCVSLYNNAVLNSKVPEEIATELKMLKIAVVDIPTVV